MIQFFLLSAGLGERALPLTLVKPKPAFPLHGIPLLSLMLEQLQDKQLNHGVINVHHLPLQVQAHIPSSMTIKVVFENQLSGNKILKTALPPEDEPLLVVNGDVFVDIPVRKMMNKMAACDCDAVILTRKSERQDCPALDISGDRFLTRKPWDNDLDQMYTGIALLKRRVIETIDELNIFDSLAKNRFDIRIVSHDGIWLDIGTPAHYFAANRIYREYINNPDSSSFSKGVEISADAEVVDSIVWENTKIVGHSSIKQCIVMNDLILKDVHYQRKIVGANQVWDLDLL